MPRKTFLLERGVMLVLLFFGLLLGAGWAQNESVLYSFCAQEKCSDGENPLAGLVFDQKGNLYGTTKFGGTSNPDGCYGYLVYGCGAVFKLTPGGKETVLYSFCAKANCTDGANPYAGLVFDQKGNLYGTTAYGGAYTGGVAFKLTPEGKETVLYSFCAHPNCTDGGYPQAGLIIDKNGNLYGTAGGGGANGQGVVFKLTPKGKETVLYSFCAQNNCNDGAYPDAGLVQDQTGNLYGTTFNGGAYSGGVVFKLSPEGTETVIHSFCAQNNCTDGANPSAGLVFDQKGKLYGTTSQGGVSNGCPGYTGCGVVFELTTKGKETVLYSFCARDNCLDGAGPYAGVVVDPKGNLYGTTQGGGGIESRGNNGAGIVPKGYSGGGVVFKVTAKGKETILRTFCEKNCTDGEYPDAGLVFDRNGNLYGTTFGGGANGQGVVFKLTP